YYFLFFFARDPIFMPSPGSFTSPQKSASNHDECPRVSRSICAHTQPERGDLRAAADRGLRRPAGDACFPAEVASRAYELVFRGTLAQNPPRLSPLRCALWVSLQ